MFQGKKLPLAEMDEGDVTDEDEGAESEKKKNKSKVILKCSCFLFSSPERIVHCTQASDKIVSSFIL